MVQTVVLSQKFRGNKCYTTPVDKKTVTKLEKESLGKEIWQLDIYEFFIF